jgi:uncharacterized surface protein with fasciclin (FAS1) repeats
MMKKSLHAAVAVVAAVAMSACSSAITSQDLQPTQNIVQVAAANGNFKTLVAAVNAAGLAETLQGPGPFTVFAPTDAAFAKLPAGTIDALLANKQKLASILTYHVVSGKVVAADITRMNGATPTTVNGQKLNVTVRGGKVYVNDAQVTTADVYASNGVIHVIDAVLMPTP